MQFPAEVFDATNHPTWNSPGTTVNASGYGQITSASAQRCNWPSSCPSNAAGRTNPALF